MRATFRKQSFPIVYCCVTAIILRHAQVLNAQQSKPNETLVTSQFDYSRTFRQDVCSVASFNNNTFDFHEHGLMGKSLNVWLYNDSYVNTREDGSIDDDDPGIVVLVLDKMAEMANFTWRDSFVLDTFDFRNPQNRTFTDLAVWATKTYDIAATWIVHTSERGALGISYPLGWYDSSLIIIGSKNKRSDTSRFSFKSWTTPFSGGVWLMLIVTLVITGIFFACFEAGTKPLHGGVKGLKYLRLPYNILGSFIGFTGHLNVDMERQSILIVKFSLSVFAILMIAAYTANLASFLVVTNSPFMQVNNIGDIVNQQLRMCVIGGSSSIERIKLIHPAALFETKGTDKEVVAGLRAGDCTYGIISAGFWRENSVSSDINNDCALTQIGNTVVHGEAGFATRSDLEWKCTSLIRDILQIHMQAIADDNSLEDIWQKQMERSRDITCSDKFNEGKNRQLNLINMGGIFILHLFIMALAVVRSIVKYFFRTRTKAKRVKEKQNVEGANTAHEDNMNAHSIEAAFEVIQEQLAYLKDCTV